MSQQISSFVAVLGDVIIDEIYQGRKEGNRFRSTLPVRKEHGGVGRVWDEISNQANYSVKLASLFPALNSSNLYTIKRYYANDELLFEAHPLLSDSPYYSQSIILGSIPDPIDLATKMLHYRLFVVSDYNKGMANVWTERLTEYLRRCKFNAIIVDSKYGTLPLQYLDLAELKILHVTNDEINKHDVNNYDWVLHTRGPGPIDILYKGKYVAAVLPPSVAVANTIGAGDVFIGSLSAFFANNQYTKQLQTEHMLAAVNYAVERCSIFVQSF